MTASKELEFHPISQVLPPMAESFLDELAKDIQENGLINPIITYEGKILDGRNRYKACQKVNIKPRFQEFKDGNPWKYVMSLNLKRRDLTEVQKVLGHDKLLEGSDKWEGLRADIQSKANQKRSEATKAQPRTDDGQRLASGGGPEGTTTRDHVHVMRTAKATEIGVNPAAVKKAERLEKHPEMAAAVLNGTMKCAEATRQIKKEEVKAKTKALPDGKYRVIYADPPWKYSDERQTGDHRESTGVVDHYAPMEFEELKALDVKGLAPENCVLFCWATFPLLPRSLELVKAWGFTYKTAFVWHKDGGAFGHYHNADAELLLIATKGSGVPDAETKVGQVQYHKREGHSRKPEAFRAIIESLYTEGARIELFRRGDAPESWRVWGAEAEE